jgi:hypothetical protein
MAGETDDPEAAAARLEAALERIAQHAGSRPHAGAPPDASDAGSEAGDLPVDVTGLAPVVEEIAARLDGLIDRLRAALNASSGRGPG